MVRFKVQAGICVELGVSVTQRGTAHDSAEVPRGDYLEPPLQLENVWRCGGAIWNP